MKSIVLRVVSGVAIAAGSATVLRGQATVCDSPCKILRLPLIVPNDKPVPNSNPLAELQGRMNAMNQQFSADAYADSEVDRAVIQVQNGVMPQYPDELLAVRGNGAITVSFVVDTTGRADSASLKVVRTSSAYLEAAVREALPRMRFIPAERRGGKVRQIVQHTFDFDITRALPCVSPCPFELLPLVNPRPTSSSQKKLPFIVEKVREEDMPVNRTYFSYQVTAPSAPRPGTVMPVYPDSLKRGHITGEVVMSFAVDTTGRVDIETIRVLEWTEQQFVVAVLDVLPKMEFVPAELHGVKVRQLVQLPFLFPAK